MKLLDLPNEVLQGICNHLGENWAIESGHSIFAISDYVPDSASLARLCLVCRRLRDVAQPVLFERFHRSAQWKSQNDARLLRFVLAVARNPRLARCVRLVHADDLQPDDDMEGTDDEALLVSLAKDKLGFPSQADVNRTSYYSIKPMYSLQDAIPALLLLLCPKLEEFKVNIWDTDALDGDPNGWIPGWSMGPWRDAGQLDKQPAEHSRKLALTSLTLELGTEDAEDGDMVGPDLAFLKDIARCAPHLRQLRVSDCLCLLAPNDIALGNLTLLHLNHCGLDRRTLRRLLNATAHLETFSYSPFISSESGLIGDQSSPKDIFESLAASPCRETLVHLSVDFYICTAELLGEGQDLTSFLAARPASSRFPFPRLQTLVLSDSSLYGPKHGGGSVVLGDALPIGMRVLEVVAVLDPLRPRDDLVRVARRSSALELPEMRVISVEEARPSMRHPGEEISTDWGGEFGYEALFNALEEEPGEVPRCHYYQKNVNTSMSM